MIGQVFQGPLIARGFGRTDLMGKRAAAKKVKASPPPKRGKKEKKPEEAKDEQKSDKKKDPPIPPFCAVNSKDMAAFSNVNADALIPHPTHARKKARVEQPLSSSGAAASSAGLEPSSVSEPSASSGVDATVPVSEHSSSAGVDATSGLVLSKWGDYAVPGEGGPSWTCDRADPVFHRIYKNCREHRLFSYYMMAISDTSDPRTKDNGWCWTYNDPLGELHDFNKFMFSNGYEPFDISKIPWKKNTGETKKENAVVEEPVEQIQDATAETVAAIAEVADVQKGSDAQKTEAPSTTGDQSTEVAASREAIEQPTTSKASDGTFAVQSLSGEADPDVVQKDSDAPKADDTKDGQSAEVAAGGEAKGEMTTNEAIDEELAVQSPSAAETLEPKSAEALEQNPADSTAGKVVDEDKEKAEVPSAKTTDDHATEVVPEHENNTGKREPWTLDRLLGCENLANMMKETEELSVLEPDEFESIMSSIRAHAKFSEVVKRIEDEAVDADLSAADQWRFGINAEDVGEDIESWCDMYFQMHSSLNKPPQGRVATMFVVFKS